MKKVIVKKYSCFLFGEGRKEKNFLIRLIELNKFKYHTKKWEFNYDNAHGSSAKDILKLCKKRTQNRSYDLIMCFIDLDDLKSDFPLMWKKEKEKLEQKYLDFVIIWQKDNAEQEYIKVLGLSEKSSKKKINKTAKEQIEKFINSDLWKKILDPIENKEKELDINKGG